VALANRVRAFLDDATDRLVPETERGGRTLAAIVHDAVADYPDLPVETNLDLATGVGVTEPAVEALRDAIGTVLSNVRLHARATSVVIHADADPGENEWELTVIDDGCGFDLETTPQGFGLRVQVKQALAEHGISAHVHSVPGDGTRVTVRGSLTSGDETTRR
jgi:signal transduction histidine kinase